MRSHETRGAADEQAMPDRSGDPLEGLWHWTDHPVARVGIVVLIMVATLVLFPVLAQWAF